MTTQRGRDDSAVGGTTQRGRISAGGTTQRGMGRLSGGARGSGGVRGSRGGTISKLLRFRGRQAWTWDEGSRRAGGWQPQHGGSRRVRASAHGVQEDGRCREEARDKDGSEQHEQKVEPVIPGD